MAFVRYLRAEVTWKVSGIPAAGPTPKSTMTSPWARAPGPRAFTAAMASFSLAKTRAGPSWKKTPPSPRSVRSIAVLLTRAPSGSEVALKKRDGAGQARRLRRSRRRTGSPRPGRPGLIPSAFPPGASVFRTIPTTPDSDRGFVRSPLKALSLRRPNSLKWRASPSGTPPARNTLHGRKIPGPIRKGIDSWSGHRRG